MANLKMYLLEDEKNAEKTKKTCVLLHGAFCTGTPGNPGSLE